MDWWSLLNRLRTYHTQYMKKRTGGRAPGSLQRSCSYLHWKMFMWKWLLLNWHFWSPGIGLAIQQHSRKICDLLLWLALTNQVLTQRTVQIVAWKKMQISLKLRFTKSYIHTHTVCLTHTLSHKIQVNHCYFEDTSKLMLSNFAPWVEQFTCFYLQCPCLAFRLASVLHLAESVTPQ